MDNNPGDRQAQCGGLLNPVAWSQNKKKGYVIHYVCQGCGMKKVNQFLQNDAFMADDFHRLLELSSVTENS